MSKHYNRVLFKHSPLKLVIGQIHFPLLFRFKENPFLAPFQEFIRDEYPRVTPEQRVGIKFSNKGLETVGESHWRFASKDSRYSVVLSETALTLECRSYEAIDPFAERFERLLVAASKHLGVQTRSRLGLRYVNELRSPNADNLNKWSALLNPRFVGFAGADVLPGSVENAFHDIKSKRDDGTLIVRHGLLDGQAIEPVAGVKPEDGPFYMIDLDYFDDRECPLDANRTLVQLRAYNESMYQFFRWAIDGAVYSDLGPHTPRIHHDG